METSNNEGKEFTTNQTSQISNMLKGEISEENLKLMMKYSKEAKESSYSPYSKFRVGCCLLTEDGKFITGTNVENLSYGLSICAERSAFCKAITQGESKFLAAMVTSDMDYYVSPCGACRQFLNEFRVSHCFLLSNNNKIEYFTCDYLLPAAVTIHHLGDKEKPKTRKTKTKQVRNGRTKNKLKRK